MNRKQWERVETIVDRAMTLQRGRREAFVREACSGDRELLESVTSLLKSIDTSEGFLDHALNDRKELFSDLTQAMKPGNRSREGSKIGPYYISEQLGRGGMGTVYRAERSDGEFSRQAALKIISRGMDTQDNLRRFQIEREILASLNHPNIARLYDGGITDDGLPYIVMEYIEGTPIDRYCQEQHLSSGERLKLFLDVCDAVQHAHNNLIVHRDLKAANILVTEAGKVKILDFGIAKLLDEEMIERTLPVTRAGKRLLTPHYAAPEQFREQPVTTATDVYTLGVLLHRLMTGEFPFQPDKRRFYELEQMILNQEADQPSQRVDRSGQAHAYRYLKGDLDSIILKSLRKEPEHRYRTVEKLVDDLLRFKRGLPVLARKGNALYRAGKFTKRHSVALLTGILFLTTIGIFSYVHTTQITRERNLAQQEAQKAGQMNEFLVNLFNAAKPSEAQGDTLTVHEVLRQGVQKIDGLSDQPEIQAEMLTVIGNVYLKMALYDKARPVLERSLGLQEKHGLFPSKNYGTTLDFLGQLKMDRGNYAAAETLYINAEKSLRKLSPLPGEELGSVLTDLAMSYSASGKHELAEKTQKKALAIYRETMGEESKEVAIGTNSLAIMQKNIGRLDEALVSYQKALALEKKLLGPLHPRTVTTTNNLANLLNKMGRSEEAEPLMREALAKRRELFGKYHNFIASSLNGLAVILQNQGRARETGPLYREALDILKHLHGARHPYVAFTLGNWGKALVAQGNLMNAEKKYKEAESILLEKLGPDHPNFTIEHSYLAAVKYYRHQYPESDTLYREVISAFRHQFNNTHPRLGRALIKHGLVLIKLGRYNEAQQEIREGYSILESKMDSRTTGMATAQAALGWCRLQDGYQAEALHSLREGYLFVVDKLGPDHPLCTDLFAKLELAYAQSGRPGAGAAIRDSLQTLSL